MWEKLDAFSLVGFGNTNFKLSIRIGKKCDSSDSKCGTVVGAR